MVLKTTTKAGKTQKIPKENVETNLNHKFFSADFISDHLKVFSKPLEIIIFRILWSKLKGNQNYKKRYLKIKKNYENLSHRTHKTHS